MNKSNKKIILKSNVHSKHMRPRENTISQSLGKHSEYIKMAISDEKDTAKWGQEDWGEQETKSNEGNQRGSGESLQSVYLEAVWSRIMHAYPNFWEECLSNVPRKNMHRFLTEILVRFQWPYVEGTEIADDKNHWVYSSTYVFEIKLHDVISLEKV